MKLHVNTYLESTGDDIKKPWTPNQEIPGLQFSQSLFKRATQLVYWRNRLDVPLFNKFTFPKNVCVPAEALSWHHRWQFGVCRSSHIKNAFVFTPLPFFCPPSLYIHLLFVS
jgi:hypothetical protein